MTTPRTLREQARDELIEKLKAERDSARYELEQLKKDKERLGGACTKAARFFATEVPANVPAGFWERYVGLKEAAIKAIDAAMRKET